MKRWNKKAGNFQIWIEIVLFLILFLAIMTIIGLDMNNTYDKNNDLTIGLDLSNELSNLSEYSQDVINQTTSGQSSMTDYGILKLTSAPFLILKLAKIMWSFVSGSFIFDVIKNMGLGGYGLILGIVFQLLYIIAIAFIFLKLVLRVNI